MAGEDGEGAVELLGEEDAGEFVRKGESGEGDFQGCAGLGFQEEAREVVRKTFRVTAEEDEFPCAAVAKVAEPAGELRGSELPAGGVEEDEHGGGIEFELAQARMRGVAEFGDIEIAIVAEAGEIVVEEGATFGAAGFAEHEQTDVHI
jgi:hypothetical protein